MDNNKFHLRAILILLLFLSFLPVNTHAQWRVGLTAGADYNIYHIDKHYMLDWHYEGAWGATAGIMGQYDFNDWFGLRAEINWAMKNHKGYRTGFRSDNYYKEFNHYVQLPLMVSFNFGSPKIKGFLNLGVYGGYRFQRKGNGSTTGFLYTWSHNIAFPYTVYAPPLKYDFDGVNSEKDSNIDYGYMGGLGVEWKFASKWSCQMEARCYYSIKSVQKDYMIIKDPKYNTTFSIQATFCRYF